MTDAQNSLLQKKTDLKFYYEMAQEAFQANDVDEALKISNNGLKQAKLQKQIDWIQKFNSFQDDIKTPHSTFLKPSIMKQDITVIRGIGGTVAEQLHNAGINSVKALANSNPNQLSRIKGIGLTTANKLIRNAKIYLESNLKTLDQFSDTYIPKIEIESYIDSENNPNELEYESEQFEESEDPLGDSMKTEEFGTTENESKIYDTEMPENILDMQSKILHQKDFKLTEGVNLSKKILSHSQIKDITTEISKELELSEFFIVKPTQELRTIFTGIDLLAIRLTKVHEFLDLIFIVPIKICTLTESLIISDTSISYHSAENIPENDYHLEKLLQSYIQALSNCGQLVYEDIGKEGALFRYLAKYLHLDISLEKTFTHKNLFFRSGPLQYKILVESVLVSQNKVGFTEKLIPFAYQKNSNIHVVEVSHLSDLLQFLDQKYFLVETYSKKESSLALYCKASNKFMEDLRKFSAPFMIYGVIFLFIFLFQDYSLLFWLINLGYGVFAFYTLVVGYIYLRFYKHKREFQQEFSIPYFQRKFEFDDTELILIREELSKPLMAQFTYEMLGKDANSKVISELEKNNAETYLKTKEKERKERENNSISKLFEPKTQPKNSELKNKLVEKYSSFLED